MPMKGPMAEHGIEGPIYADRVKGRLTFLDWDGWTEEDRREYADEYENHSHGRDDMGLVGSCSRFWHDALKGDPA